MLIKTERIKTEQTEKRSEFKALAFFLFALFLGCGMYWAVGARLSKSMLDSFGTFDYQAIRYLKARSSRNSGVYPDVLLSLGDSTASRNLLVNNLHKRSLALNVLGGSLIEPTMLLREYLKYNAPPECVLIMTSYGALQSHYQNYFWKLLVGFGLYSKSGHSQLYEVSREHDEHPGAKFSRIEWWRNFYFSFNGDWIDFSLIQRGIWDSRIQHKARRALRFFNANHGAAPLSTEQAHRDKTVFVADNHRFLHDSFLPEKTLDVYIREMLKLLEGAKVSSIFLVPPIAESARTATSEEWFRNYKAHIGKILDDFPSSRRVLEPQWLPDSQFVDTNHLSAAWAKRYTLGLQAEVEACRARSATKP